MNSLVLVSRDSRPLLQSLLGWLQRPTRLIAATCLWMATVGNLALWSELLKLSLWHGLSGWALAAGLATATGALVALIVGAFAWRWTLKPVLVVLLLTSAASAHFMLSYGVVLDQGMLANVLQTNPHEALDLISPRLLLDLLWLGVLPAAVVWQMPVHYGSPQRRMKGNLKFTLGAALLAALTVIACFAPLASTMRNHRQVRYLLNPLNVMYGLGSLALSGHARSGDVRPVGEDAVLGTRFETTRPPLVVLVLGETGRAGNFGLNGYARDTSPLLAQQDVISFSNVWSCGTSTAAAVPCMFSPLPRSGFFDRDHEQEGLLDVLQRAGLAILWIDNQSGCKGVCDRVPHTSTEAANHPSLCTDGECLDGVMLDGLDERLAHLPAERRARGVVLVMHQMGSHGPAYHRRSPPQSKRFLPECTHTELQDCTQAELVNAYDNSIVYTDRMLGDTIQWLERQAPHWSPAMVYVADHGESLGENNLYLHGLPYAMAPDVQKHVPWITWMSPGFAHVSGLNRKCLHEHLNTELSHDHYFHSVLGLLDVRTRIYQPALDAYAACRDTVR